MSVDVDDIQSLVETQASSSHAMGSDSGIFELPSNNDESFTDFETVSVMNKDAERNSFLHESLFDDMDYTPQAKRTRIAPKSEFNDLDVATPSTSKDSLTSSNSNNVHQEDSISPVPPNDSSSSTRNLYEYYFEASKCDDILHKLERDLLDEDSELNRREREFNARVEEVLEDDRKALAREKRLNRLHHRSLEKANKKHKVFCCFVCNRAFPDEESVRKHVNDAHLKPEEFKFKCQYCYMRFDKRQKLLRHEQTHDHAKNGKFGCRLCDSTYREELSLAIHLSQEHSVTVDYEPLQDKEFRCGCGSEFGLREEFKRHEYYCKNKETILLKRKLAKEKVMLGSTLASPASEFSKSTNDSTSSGRQKKDKSCPYCLDNFASIQSRNRHIGRKHPEMANNQETVVHTYDPAEADDLPYVCVTCQKRFSTNASLTLHKKRVHDKELNFVCNLCDKRYPIASELRKHIKRSHTMDMEELPIVDEANSYEDLDKL